MTKATKKNDKRTVAISVRLKHEHDAAISKIAEEHGMLRASYIAHLVVKEITRHKENRARRKRSRQ